MKTLFPILVLFSCVTVSVQAQFTSQWAAALASGTAAPPAARRTFMATERGPHHTRWTSVESRTNSAGRIFMRTNAYVELGTGINRQAGNQWVASAPEIEPAPGGAVGSKGRHQVRFSSNLNTQGAIRLTGPDGRTVRSQILGLSYYDASTGTNVLIAVTKSSQGQILPSKQQVLYADGFSGVKADIRYTYTVAGLEQDVILREQLPAPEAYGLDSQTTELEVLTEYLDMPTSQTVGATDDEIKFGSMHLAAGRAFPLGQPTSYLRVTNRWAQVNGRQILIESISASAVRKATAQLAKPHASLLNRNPRSSRQPPTLPKTAEPSESMMMARVAPAEPGFVLDWYMTLDPDILDSYTFQAGTMYLITNLCGVVNATFEGGTVLKFAPSAMLGVSNIVSTATQYEPIIFTSQADNSVSWDVSAGYTNEPVPLGFPIAFNLVIFVPDGVVTLANMQFRGPYGGVALFPTNLVLFGGDPLTSQFVNCALDIWDCQFVNCPIGVFAKQVSLHNVLFSGCQFPVGNLGTTNSQLTGEQVTADGFSAFYASLLDHSAHLCLTNSILTGGGLLNAFTDESENSVPSGSNDLNQVFCSTNSADIFTSFGAGNYYLAGTNLLHIGDTNISPRMALELPQKTTAPPMRLTNTSIGDATQAVNNLGL